MPKILVFQHVPYEILGNLNPLLKEAGFRIRYVNFGRKPDARPSLTPYDGLVILGGPMNVDEVEKHPHLVTEVELIQQAIAEGMPILGICLGAQLIAKALGAKVTQNPAKEIGWYDVTPSEAGHTDPLLQHFEGTQKIFQWHGDTFSIPLDAVHLASSPDCANQAFRYGDNVYGFQFHLEVDARLIDTWLQRPAYQQEIAETRGRILPETIAEETVHYVDPANKLAEKVFGSFIEILGFVKKFRTIGSR